VLKTVLCTDHIEFEGNAKMQKKRFQWLDQSLKKDKPASLL
jgi:hypothetical protein